MAFLVRSLLIVLVTWVTLVAASAPLPDAVDLCDYNASLCGLQSFSGMVPIRGKGSLFYWYFAHTGGNTSAPLVLWLQGGPGGSSQIGNLFEMGPITLSASGDLQRRPDVETWASRVSLLFVDSPVGVGWSIAENDEGYARNESDVAEALVEFLAQFKQLHPEAPPDIVVAGESFGGHFVPAVGARLLQQGSAAAFRLQGILIGDGLTDPATQVLTKPYTAFAFGLIDEKQRAEAAALAQQAHDLVMQGDYGGAYLKRAAVESFVESQSHINPYDVRTTDQYDFESRMEKFFNQVAVKDMLHIPQHREFVNNPPLVKQHLQDDIMRSQKPNVEFLLRSGVRVLLYQGQFDWKDGTVSNEAWIRTMNWPGASGYLNASRAVWSRADDGYIAGYWRSFENLHQVVVLGAGHFLSMNQPLSSLDMLTRFLHLRRPPSVVSTIVV